MTRTPKDPADWLTDEGLRLFFPAAAIHGAIWPLLWVALYDFDLPLARSIPVSQWHAHEMIFGTYGMALAGIGFAVIGLSGLGFPLLESTGLHLLSMGSLGMAVVSVFVIAGLRHTGRPLVLPIPAHVALGLMLAAALVRTLPELGVLENLLGLHYAIGALLWAGAFAAWLRGFLPFMLAPGLGGTETV